MTIPYHDKHYTETHFLVISEHPGFTVTKSFLDSTLAERHAASLGANLVAKAVPTITLTHVACVCEVPKSRFIDTDFDQFACQCGGWLTGLEALARKPQPEKEK